MTKTEKRVLATLAHMENLSKIFPDMGLQGASAAEMLAVAGRLRRLERRGIRLGTNLCNGDIDSEVGEALEKQILAELNAIIGETDAELFINLDPRGHALKISDESIKEINLAGIVTRDWGGYGIIMPDFDNE